MAPSRLSGLASALAVCAGAMASGLRPPPQVDVARWAAEKRVVSADSGSPYPGRWSNDLAPFGVEIMEALSLSDPATSVTFMKSSQVAGTEMGINLLGAIIDSTPAPVLVLLPSLDEKKSYIRLKLNPTIKATAALRAKVIEQVSRDEEASTTDTKYFPGGFVQIGTASSSKGLQMRSVRVVILEEVSEYPFDVDGRGDPVDLAIERTNAWSGREKVFYNSTPGLKGQCRISVRFEKSDQRRFFVPCPHCEAFQVLEFRRLDTRAGAAATYACQACGVAIEHGRQRGMLARGTWLKTFPGTDAAPAPPATVAPADIAAWRARGSAGRQPGFALNALYSPFLPWAKIAERWRDAQGDAAKMKVFVQQTLGEAYEETGEVPDHERLFERRIDYAWRRVPFGAVFLTAAADVQQNRIEWDVYAWGLGLTSWHIDSGIVAGDTADNATWAAFAPLLDRRYPDAFGTPRPIDEVGIDAGYASQKVYAFVERHAARHRVRALDGRPGWKLPPLGLPVAKSIDYDGVRNRAVELWPVGTWDMKSELYVGLRKLIQGPDRETGVWPQGTAFYSQQVDRDFLKQLTAEYRGEIDRRNGMTITAWIHNRAVPNERHDTAVYARALAHAHSAGATEQRWAELLRERTTPPQQAQADMAALWTAPPGTVAIAGAAAPLLPVAAPAASPAVGSTSSPPPAPGPAMVDPARSGPRRLGPGGRRLQ